MKNTCIHQIKANVVQKKHQSKLNAREEEQKRDLYALKYGKPNREKEREGLTETEREEEEEEEMGTKNS